MVVFLDACYSGAAGGRTFASKQTRAVNVDDMFLDRLTRSKGRAIVTASRPSEVSIELAELGHGIFTYYLVRGPARATPTSTATGSSSLQELYEYLAQQVSRKSRAGGRQPAPDDEGRDGRRAAAHPHREAQLAGAASPASPPASAASP